MNNIVPIVLAFDNNFSIPALATITSILENKNKDTFCDIFIFSNDIGKITTKKINWLKSIYTNFDINIINPQGAYSDAHQGHLTTPNYYRFLIPDYLQKYPKAIWCDVDVIITSDLYNLIENFDSNSHIMAAKGTSVPTKWIYSKEAEGNKISVDYTNYFNAGFYVVDIEKTIENCLTEKINTLIQSNKFSFPTQDVMNLAYVNKISFLTLKYNFTVGYFANTIHIADEKDIKKKYTKLINITSYEELREAIDHPVVIHFNGKRKPWLEFNPLNKYHFIWYYYYLKMMNFEDASQRNFFIKHATASLHKKKMFRYAMATEFNGKFWLLKEILKKLF